MSLKKWKKQANSSEFSKYKLISQTCNLESIFNQFNDEG
jgi:hypothetical protein